MIPEGWDLTDKRALITADNRGWTPVLASALAEAGANVAVVGPSEECVAQTARAVREQGRDTLEYAIDLTAGDQVRSAIQQVVDRWGGLDILVNNAQAQFGKPFNDVTEEEWDRLMALNVRAPFLFCREAGRHMMSAGGGRMVNIISGLAERALSNSVAYCASQGAALQLTRALGLEWARSNIRVNAIAAGWLTMEEHSPKEAEEGPIARFLPLRRWGHPRELGPLLVYLASDACDFVTGTAVFVDGGAMAHG